MKEKEEYIIEKFHNRNKIYIKYIQDGDVKYIRVGSYNEKSIAEYCICESKPGSDYFLPEISEFEDSLNLLKGKKNRTARKWFMKRAFKLVIKKKYTLKDFLIGGTYLNLKKIYKIEEED